MNKCDVKQGRKLNPPQRVASDVVYAFGILAYLVLGSYLLLIL